MGYLLSAQRKLNLGYRLDLATCYDALYGDIGRCFSIVNLVTFQNFSLR